MSLTNIVKTELIRSIANSARSKEKAFLSATFLWTGSISISHGYHLEFKVHEEEMADDIVRAMDKFGVEAKKIIHQNKFVVYVKGAEKVTDALAALGAPKAVLSLHEITVLKNVRAKANRLSNYDVSNINKSLVSSHEQIEAIKKLQERGVFDTLDEKLKEVAEAREKNPSASYEELAGMLGISKSGLRHRLNKILNS
ncbi:MAG: DNA-binding protein WhiA [Firmicutes bacterium]|nr:DNA-binding protein WhiA [Bacillota bacterium]